MKKNLVVSFCVGVVLTLGSFTVYAQSAEVQRANWRWAHFAPPTWGAAQADQLFAKEIETRSGGRIKTQFFWSGSLFGFGELFGAVSKNAIDVASFVPSYHPSEWPMMSLVNSLPMVWSDPKLAMRTQEFLIKNNKAIQAELKKHNLTPVLLHGLPIYRLQCTMPIRKIEDLRGKRIRTFGDWPPFIMEKLGAVPVNIPLGQIYEGLQKGTLDCGYNPVENAGFLKLSEVAKFWSDIDFGAIAAYTTFMNTDRYQKLPDNLKKILADSASVAMQFEMGNFETLEKKWLGDAQAAGVTLVKFEDQAKLKAMFPDMLGVWEETMCKKNMCPEAKSVVADIRKLLSEAKR